MWRSTITGLGLSSLAYLKQLPAQELKIDKLFVQNITSSQRDALLVRSTIDLAHGLGMNVTAEGVETPAAFALLASMNCDLAQGYLISRPCSIEELVALLGDDRRLQFYKQTALGAAPTLTNVHLSLSRLKISSGSSVVSLRVLQDDRAFHVRDRRAAQQLLLHDLLEVRQIARDDLHEIIGLARRHHAERDFAHALDQIAERLHIARAWSRKRTRMIAEQVRPASFGSSTPTMPRKTPSSFSLASRRDTWLAETPACSARSD
jgi:hypothetical protein